jgi:hypothetical protein
MVEIHGHGSTIAGTRLDRPDQMPQVLHFSLECPHVILQILHVALAGEDDAGIQLLNFAT